MRKIKLTYVLELEVPAEAMLQDGDAFIHGVRQMLGMNTERGWKASLRRLVDVSSSRKPNPGPKVDPVSVPRIRKNGLVH